MTGILDLQYMLEKIFLIRIKYRRPKKKDQYFDHKKCLNKIVACR